MCLCFLLLFFFFFPLFSRRSKIDPHFVALYSGQPLARKRTSFRRAFQKHFGTLQGASTPCAVTHRYDDDLFTPVLDGEIVENGIWDQESGPTLGPKCLEYSIPSPIFFSRMGIDDWISYHYCSMHA